ncbi:peptidase M28 [Lewinellaceae bacterium SD302]|nr:peptidase M28 [Lewinellaceae bacterium SD302]
MKQLLLAISLFTLFALSAQSGRVNYDLVAPSLAKTITTEEMFRHLSYIASDEMEGRETGQPGQKRAAEYIAQNLKSMGFPAVGENGGYFQTILFKKQRWNNISLSNQGEELKHLRDFYSVPAQNTSLGEEAVSINELTFLGYGIEDEGYNDYANAGELKGKSILIFGGEPRDMSGAYRLSGNSDMSDWSLNVDRKLALAAEKGVATVFIVDPEFRENVGNIRREILDGRMKMAEEKEADRVGANSVFISTQLARDLLGKKFKKIVKARKKLEKTGSLKPVAVDVDLQLTQDKQVSELIGENVLGYLEGRDPELKDEIVVYSAHYDHIGKRGDEIFNGADDNGSGTTTLLEIADAYMQAKKQGNGPRRTVLFVWVSGEEKGLLGSKYYVNHPIWPLANTVVDINVDMVGRVDEKHADNPEYIYVIGSNRLSTDLHDINEEMNKRYVNLELDYTYNAEDDPNRYYYRSDHYNFAERGIPSIFYFNGTHEDYHGAGDTVDKINFDKMQKIGELIFHTGWEIANRNERIRVNVGQ